MEYADHVAVLKEQRPDLTAELTPLRTLEHVLGWLGRRGLSLAKLDLITQDEYCHDLLVPLGDDGMVLSFGMT
jgi:hypothetical protein